MADDKIDLKMILDLIDLDIKVKLSYIHLEINKFNLSSDRSELLLMLHGSASYVLCMWFNIQMVDPILMN